jgi:hypothetical protein
VSQPVEPTSFGPNKGPGTIIDDPSYVHGLTRTATSPVTVTLGGRESCGGLLVYTKYSLQLAAGAQTPTYWPSGETGELPCQVNAGGYYPDAPPTRESERDGGCVFHGLEVNAQSMPDVPWLPGSNVPLAVVPWRPSLPRGSAYSDFCRVQWTSWGAPTATGVGVFRNGFDQWGVKAQLSGLGWCPKLGIAYTRLKATLFGAGEPITGSGNLSPSVANRLRRGGRSLPPHAHVQVEPAAAHCVEGLSG